MHSGDPSVRGGGAAGLGERPFGLGVDALEGGFLTVAGCGGAGASIMTFTYSCPELRMYCIVTPGMTCVTRLVNGRPLMSVV